MRIYGLMLENIRSFRKEYVVFPNKGVTVIHGATGSGKTSILMSVSAALFGLQRESRDPFRAFAYPTGRDLVRADASSARIRLLFEHNGKLYLVEREFRRDGERVVNAEYNRLEEYVVDSSGRVVNTNQWILSPTELNKRVKEILGIKEKAREQPLLFTSVLYAPQFNIHEVLSLSDEDRTEIIERSLGLSKYKEYKKNSEEVENIIRSRVDELARNMERLKTRLRERSKESLLEEKKRLTAEVEGYEKARTEKLRRLEEVEASIEREQRLLMEAEREVAELKSRIEQARRLEARLREIEGEIAGVAAGIGGVEADPASILGELTRRIDEASGRLRELHEKEALIEEEIEGFEQRLEEARRAYSELKAKIGGLESDKRNILARRRELEDQLKRYKELLERGICPLCLQPIPHEHGVKLIDEVSKGIRDLEEKARETEEKRTGIAAEISRVEEEIRRLEGEVRGRKAERDRVRGEYKKLEEEVRRLQLTAEKIRSMLREAERVRAELSGAAGLEDKLKEALSKRSSVEAALRELREVEKGLQAEIRELDSRIARSKASIEYVEKMIHEIERDEEELRRLEEEKMFHEWMLALLASLNEVVDEVEKRVSLEVVQEFRRRFYAILGTLMREQPVEVVVRDDFTLESKVKIGGKAYAISSLSGGQSIAISLAYRLALNATVRAYSPFLRNTVLILDEPTTGFSQELVRRLGEALRLMSSARGQGQEGGQIIVVTHDELLKDIGDCRIMLERDALNHVSRVKGYECVDFKNFDDYKKLVEEILSGRFSRRTTGPVEGGGFKPVVSLEAGGSARKKSILEFSRGQGGKKSGVG